MIVSLKEFLESTSCPNNPCEKDLIPWKLNIFFKITAQFTNKELFVGMDVTIRKTLMPRYSSRVLMPILSAL